MILSEKIIALRKQRGWSQEELADQLGVSRQSVSKWELGAAIPDLDKVLKLGSLFGVSTDYLLKEDMEDITFTGEESREEDGRRVSVEEANGFMELQRRLSGRMAGGVSLFILCPICLIQLSAAAEYYRTISEDAATAIGMSVLLALVAAGVAMVLSTGMQLAKYRYLGEERLCLDYGVAGIVEKRRNELERGHRRDITLGVVLCILSVIPIFVGVGLGANDFITVMFVNLLLVFVAAAVNLFVRTGMVYGSCEKLLQIGDYTVEKKQTEKKVEKKMGAFAGIYWCAVTAIYLGVSFVTEAWGMTWIIWPVAAVAFGAVRGIVRLTVE